MAKSWHDRICGPECGFFQCYRYGIDSACKIGIEPHYAGMRCWLQPIATAVRAPLLEELKELRAENHKLRYEIEVLREDDE